MLILKCQYSQLDILESQSHPDPSPWGHQLLKVSSPVDKSGIHSNGTPLGFVPMASLPGSCLARLLPSEGTGILCKQRVSVTLPPPPQANLRNLLSEVNESFVGPGEQNFMGPLFGETIVLACVCVWGLLKLRTGGSPPAVPAPYLPLPPLAFSDRNTEIQF